MMKLKITHAIGVLFLIAIHATCFGQINANWKPTGPIDFPINVSGQINGIGRVCQVKFHPSNPFKMYAASASGGLWRSSNAGLSWRVCGTDNLPSTACASVCIDPNNDSIMYLGTGDPNYYNPSLGIYKSIDAGATWSPSNSLIANRMAVEMLIPTSNSNLIIAATNSGIWKSYNAGQSWVEKKPGGAFTDMKFKAGSGFDTIFAVTFSQFFRSTDLGETWTLISNGVNVPNGNGQGMRLAVSKANPNIVYLGMIADEGTILKSTDAGASFTTVYHNPAQSLVGYDASSSGQGNYNFGMTADPMDANKLFVVAHCVWRSNDGGVTWTKLTDWAVDCHTDMHQIVYSPYQSNHLLNANDGGIFISYDDGDNWNPYSDGIAATECYHAAQSPLVNSMISIGTQDNGELYYDGQWKTNRGGDWTEKMAFDYSQFNRVYYFNGNRRVVSGGDQSWAKPFTASATALQFTPLNTNVAFLGGQNVYRSNNINASTPVWTQIVANSSSVKAMAISPVDANELYVVLGNMQIKRSSNALAATPVFNMVSAPSSTANAASIAVVKSNPSVLYLSCGSKVYRSSNKGSSWTNITYTLPPVGILKIFVDEYSPIEAVYACSSMGVYYKNDTMNYWANYSQGLPGISDIQDFMMVSDGSLSSKLRVAYYGRGVWESGLYQPFLLPHADFSSPDTLACAGKTVHFENLSSSNVNSFYWTFPGGIPNSSTLSNPSVVYPSPGIYSLSLVVNNAMGSDTVSQSSFINVQGSHSLPFVETFSGTFPPSDWRLSDAGADGVTWSQSTTVGGYSASNECMLFDNYNQDALGRKDEIRTPFLDFSNLPQVMLSFDIAYAMNNAPFCDTLAVYVSSDCEASYFEVYLKDATLLATGPVQPNTTFVPGALQWRTEQINLAAFTGQPSVAIVFQNRGNTGQCLYIDNIAVTPPLGIKGVNKSIIQKLYPNPANKIVSLELYLNHSGNYSEEIMDESGRMVQQKSFYLNKGSQIISENIENLANGFYIFKISDLKAGQNFYQKFLKRNW